MNDDTFEELPVKRGTRTGLKIALVSAGVVAGAIGATAFGASAASSTSGSGSTSGSSSTGYSAQAPAAAPANGSAPSGTFNPGGSTPVRSDEKSVDASTAATLKAAALKAVPGGSVIRVETDAGDAAYEVHMHKADGTLVTVKFDKNLKETVVEDGMGKGDPAPAGAPAGAH